VISSPLNGADPDIHERWRHEMRSKPFMDDYLPEDAPEVSPIADALLSQPHFGGAGNVDEAEADHIRNSRHIRLAEESHPEHNDGANGYDDDADDGDDIEEDDGQPSEYEEWQDYFGGDEYYDHSEMGW